MPGGDMSPAFFARFVSRQPFAKLPKPTASFAGKTVIVTGSNVGLGLEASRHIINLGASKLIIALDLSSYASVKAFAARAIRELPRLDVLLENARVATGKWQFAEDNELMLAVNVVSTFLLAFLLLPKMKAAANDSHFFVDFRERSAPEGIFNHMNVKENMNVMDRYPTSKLLEVYVVREMAARGGENYPVVTINMVNPGLCESELAREGILQVRVMKFFLARTTEAGSRTLVHRDNTLDRCKVESVATIVLNSEGQKAQQRIWDELMAKLQKIEPGISGNL
ncbi:NAD(P)-binding protein [Lipomyces kononenkoae]